MDRYIGLDAHVQSCTFVVMSAAGKRLREQVVATNGEALPDLIRRVTGQKHWCLEQGTMSEWMYELFEPLVDEIVVVVPERSKGNKNDSKDAWARAQELRCGSIQRAVYKAPQKFTALREAVRADEISQRDMIRAKNRVNAIDRSRKSQSNTQASISRSGRRSHQYVTEASAARCVSTCNCRGNEAKPGTSDVGAPPSGVGSGNVARRSEKIPASGCAPSELSAEAMAFEGPTERMVPALFERSPNGLRDCD